MLAHDAEIVKINGPLVRPEDAMQKKQNQNSVRYSGWYTGGSYKF